MSFVHKAVALVGCVLLGWTSGARAQADLIVKLRPDDPESLRSHIATLARGGTVAAKSGLFAGMTRAAPAFASASIGKRGLEDIYVLTARDSAAFNASLEAWAESPSVEWVIPNHRYSVERPDDTYNDTHFDSLGHLAHIRATEAWTVTTGSGDVRIGILDTGVFLEHPDLVGQFATNPSEDLNGNGVLDAADLNGIDDDGNGYIDDVLGYDFVDRADAVDPGDYRVRDPDPSEDRFAPGLPNRLGLGHGTLVAGVAGAALNNDEGIAGVAPGARIVPLRAFAVDGLGEDDDVSAAIVYAAEQGIDVVNLSFGDTYYSPLMAEAIRYATSLGTIIVASGGNSGTDAPHYPSDYPEVIGALWLDQDGSRRGSRASYGAGIDVGAPGSFVYTTTLPPPSEMPVAQLADSLLYGYRSGSSVSAPQIAGVVALLRSVDRDLSPASIKAILASTAVDLDPPGWDHETAAGRVDAAAALDLPYPASVTITHPLHQSGFQGGILEIRGTVLNSLFQEYSVSYAVETQGEEPVWTRISGPSSSQIKNGLLAAWDASSLGDDAYLLRLQVMLKDGRTIEDRRRVILDRSPPEVTVVVADVALIEGRIGVQVEIESDDLALAELVVLKDGVEERRRSDRIALRHSRDLKWIDEAGRGGPAVFHVEVTNVAGLATATQSFSVDIPRQPPPGYVTDDVLNTPAGFLLPKAADLDRDGIPEIVLNRYQDGWLGDTVIAYEWAGFDFRPTVEIISNTFPRDTGDIDDDGNPELLLQVSAVAQVVEFSDNGRSAELVFLDTAGIRNPSADTAAWAALLGDVDADGRGEVIVHNRKAWRFLEWGGSQFVESFRLENPTDPSEGNSALLGSEVNGFAEPEAILTDLDGDGLAEFVVTDADGDFIVYEATGDNAVQPIWSYQTGRFTNQGSRLTAGDFDGDGNREFVGFVHSWPSVRDDGDYEAPLGIYYRFESEGENSFRLLDSLVVSGNLSNHGAVAAVDLDGDDADELVIAHPPNVYVVRPRPGGARQILYAREALASPFAVDAIRSISLVTGDFDGNGTPEFIAAGANQKLRKFEWSSSGTRVPAPRWIAARAVDAQTVLLSWDSSADSIEVYRSLNLGAFDRVAVVVGDSFLDAVAEKARYRLRGDYHDGLSAFSVIETVRPHDPGVVVSAEWTREHLSVLFSEPLRPDFVVSQFSLGSGGGPESVLTGEGGIRLLVRFKDQPSVGDTLKWNQLWDVEGTPIADSYVVLPARAGGEEELVLASWRAESDSEALLVFNLPLDPVSAADVDNYVVRPSGRVESAELRESAPNEVLLRVTDRSLGPTGLKTTIIVRNLRADNGSSLASEGTVATFASAASSTREAYVFPNPYRAAEHPQRIMIAGLPGRANIGIFSAQGEPVRFLEELNGDGGVPWDLRDMNGDLVPSGIYIVLVESDGHESVILKTAVVR
ncbi:MAG TPA: S8 family serine peptidase [Rhodothermia bacterium]